MRAMQVTRLDGPSALEPVEVPVPRPGPGEVVIDVHAAGVSFPEALLTRGLYQLRPDLPFTPGSECAGVVRAVGEDSRPGGVHVGDRVAAFTMLGSYAESVCVPAPFVFPLPDQVPFETAAAVPLNYLTVHFALRRRARLQPGETVLVHGAAGGIGTAGVQMAKALGANVIGVVSSDAKVATAREAGADHVVLSEGFLDAVHDVTRARGVDVVLDPVGGDRFTDSLRSLAPEGRVLVVGFTEGSIPQVKVNRLLLTNTSVLGVGVGEFWRRSPGFAREQWDEIAPMLADGRLSPPVGQVLPLERAAEALGMIERREVQGKIVLQVR